MSTETQTELPPGPSYPGSIATLKWQRDLPGLLEAGHAEFGDVWTLSLMRHAKFVIVSDPELLAGVFGAPPDVLHNEAKLATPLLGENSVIVLNEDAHRTMRDLLQPLFRSERVNEQYAGEIERIAREELATWPVGTPMPLLPRMQTITRRAIMSTIFGVTGGEVYERLSAAIIDLLAWGANTLNMAYFQMKYMKGSTPPRGFRQRRAALDEVVYDDIARARRAPDIAERDDVLAKLIQAHQADGSPISDTVVRDEIVTMLIQGHQSTANAISWAVERLLRHPDVLERLRAEVETGGEDYLDAVVAEVLRVRPPQPFAMRHVVNRPYQLGEYELPIDTIIAADIYTVNRRPEEYPEPERFRPERFLERQPGRTTWIPFGGGARGCLGASFALCEIKVVLRVLMQETRLAATDQGDEDLVRRGVGFSPKQGARAVLTERTRAEAGTTAVSAAGQ